MKQILSVFVMLFSNEVLAQSVELPPEAKNIRICPDFGSSWNCDGQPYRIVTEDRGVVTKHEGIDFVGHAGASVISASHGKIAHYGTYSCGGGTIIVATKIKDVHPETKELAPVYVRYVHTTLHPSLTAGSVVKPGDPIGFIQDPNDNSINDKCVGRHPHVHFDTIFRMKPRLVANPHNFWLGGPYKLSCFKEGQNVPEDKIVAPIRCE